jgi:hypothetical protein
MPPGTGFPFRCLSGLRWRYWNPPPHVYIYSRLSNDLYSNSVRTSHETHYVSATKPNRLMLFRETVTVYCENHTEHTNVLHSQGIEFFNVCGI